WVGTPEDKTELIFVIGRDITNIEEQKKHISITENHFKAIFENSQSLFCMHSIDGAFQLVNKTGADMAGYTVEEVVQKTLFDIIPKDHHHLLKQYLELIRTKGYAQGNMKIITKQGAVRSWMFSNVLQKDEEGNEYVIGNAVDLTE